MTQPTNGTYQRPEVPQETQDNYAAYAFKIVHTKKSGPLMIVISGLMIENDRLTTEVNQLRARLGIEQLPTYDPKV